MKSLGKQYHRCVHFFSWSDSFVHHSLECRVLIGTMVALHRSWISALEDKTCSHSDAHARIMVRSV